MSRGGIQWGSYSNKPAASIAYALAVVLRERNAPRLLGRR
jgi:hypothetical protein